MAMHTIIGTASTEGEKIKGALAYVLIWFSGIIILILAKDNRFLKFHALQSIILGILLSAIALILPCLGQLIGALGWIYCLYGAYMVYKCNEFDIPLIGDFVKDVFLK